MNNDLETKGGTLPPDPKTNKKSDFLNSEKESEVEIGTGSTLPPVLT